MYPGDRSRSSVNQVLGESEKAQHRGLSLARLNYPVKETGHYVPLSVVRHMGRNNLPCERRNRVDACRIGRKAEQMLSSDGGHRPVSKSTGIHAA